MKYYHELIKHIERTMRAHPHSTVAMDSGTFKIIARGRDTASVLGKLRRSKPPHGVPVIFRRPDEKVTWILATRSRS